MCVRRQLQFPCFPLQVPLQVPLNRHSPPFPLQMLRNRHKGVAGYYLRRRGYHFRFDTMSRLLWPSGGTGAPGGLQGNGGDMGEEGDAPEPEAWRVSEWDEELWLDLVALLYRLLVQTGGKPVSLSKLGTQVPQKAREYIDVGQGCGSFQRSECLTLYVCPHIALLGELFFHPVFIFDC